MNEGNCYREAYFLQQSGSVETLERMSVGRASPGLAVIPGTVFVFGGGYHPKSYQNIGTRPVRLFTVQRKVLLIDQTMDSLRKERSN